MNYFSGTTYPRQIKSNQNGVATIITPNYSIIENDVENNIYYNSGLFDIGASFYHDAAGLRILAEYEPLPIVKNVIQNTINEFSSQNQSNQNKQGGSNKKIIPPQIKYLKDEYSNIMGVRPNIDTPLPVDDLNVTDLATKQYSEIVAYLPVASVSKTEKLDFKLIEQSGFVLYGQNTAFSVLKQYLVGMFDTPASRKMLNLSIIETIMKEYV